MIRSNQFILVAAGSALGAVVRWLVIELPLSLSDRWVVFALNVLGSLLLGGVLGWAASRRKPDGPQRASSPNVDSVVLGVGTGFCGGLTSFSTFAVDIAQLLRSGIYSTALTTTIVTVAGATALATVGYRLAKNCI